MTNWIYIGDNASIDTDESDFDAENPNILLGTYDQTDMQLVNTTLLDGNSDGSVNDDETGAGDSIRYRLEGEPLQAHAVDSIAEYRATITRGDGSTYTSDLIVYQLTNGATFVVDKNTALDNNSIQSIELVSARDTGLTGVTNNLSVENTQVVCFASGVLVKTLAGEVAIENLAQGDQVLTADNGYQPIRWIGSKRLSAAQLDHKPNLRPIRIRAGALGPGVPESDLLVSRQHRLLICSKVASRMFDDTEVLVAAKDLLSIEGIDLAWDIDGVTYYHFLFDQHEIVLGNGAKAESLFTGPQAMKSIPAEARKEILELFPEMLEIDFEPQPARKMIAGRKARRLIQLHDANEIPMMRPRYRSLCLEGGGVFGR